MKTRTPISLSALLALVLISSGCQKKPELPPEPPGNVATGDTIYVEIYPPWRGFNRPHTILVGKDQFFYVSDYGTNRVLMLNAAGQIMASRSVLHPAGLAQDSRLDLLVGAENLVYAKFLLEDFESVWSNGGTTPPGWRRVNVADSVNWGQKTFPLNGQEPPQGGPQHGNAVAWFASNSASGVRTRLESPTMNLSTAPSPFLRFYYANASGSDSLLARVSLDNGSTWATLASLAPTGTNQWQSENISLSSAAARTSVKIALEAVADGGTSDIWVDSLLVYESSRADTVGAIFRYHIVKDRVGNFFGHSLFDRVPSELVWTEPARPQRRFPGIAVLPNNQFLVARSAAGDSIDNSSLIDPDARVLLFSQSDELITPLGDLATENGAGITDIFFPTGILPIPGKRDFVLTQKSVGGIAYGALWMTYQLTSDFEGWLPKFDPFQSIDFVKQGRFKQAQAAVIDQVKGDVFVVDAALDSVFKFDSRGRFRKESFGDRVAATPEYPDGLENPRGGAFFSKTLYIVDTGHDVVRLFRLSTDLF